MEIKNICPICGSPLEPEGKRLKCRYCGYSKAEEASSEESSLLFVAFQKLRMADFDEAGELFSDILRRFPNSAEAYWGSTLADYGIKYEDDYDGKKIPTCYAAKYESFAESSTYKKAIECATPEQKEYYESQSRKIDAVRKEWVEKAEKEPPYDVFLSFKDTDEGKRTSDSEEAYEIYNILTGLGCRVFFSRVTLAGKTGENYEPYIFAALNSAPVMLVYASRKEYIESTWVRNEWNRYLARIRIKQKQEGSICVIFKDPLDPGKLPASLRRVQNLKRTEITFLDNLRDYVDKYVSAAKVKTPRIDRKEVALAKKQGQKSIEAVKMEDVSSISVKRQGRKSIDVERRQVGSSTVAALSTSEESKLAQAEIYLSHGDPDRARSLYEDVLSTNPHSQQALVGTLLIRTGYKSLDELLENPEAVASELDLAATAVDYSEKDTAFLVLEALSKACLRRIENNDFGGGKEIYEKVSNYDVPIVNDLHKKLFLAAITKAERDEAITLCKLCLPFLSSDSALYREALERAIQGTYDAHRYKDCVDFADQYGQYYDFMAEIYKLILAAKEGCSSPEEWLADLAAKGDFSSLSGGLPLSEKEIGILFDWASDVAMGMIAIKPEPANALVRFLLPYRFPKREGFIIDGIKICQDHPNELTAKVLDGFLHAYGDDRFREFISAQEGFVDSCFAKKEYALASHYLGRLIEYDPGKSERYLLRCCANLGCRADRLNEKIHLLKDYSDVEAMIANRGKAKVAEAIDRFLSAAETAANLKEACRVFDSIISYLPKEEDAALLAHLGIMARACLNASLFEEAERYFSSIVTLDPNDHSAYLSILMAKLHVKNDVELTHQMTPIGGFVEFDNAKLSAGKDRKALEHYIEIELKQTQWIESENARIAKEEEDARKAAELEAKRQEEAKRRRAKRKKTLIIIGSSIAAAAVATGVIVPVSMIASLNGRIDSAQSSIKDKDYDAAISALSGVDYGESKNLLSMAYAGKAFQGGDYEAGIDRVLEAGGETHVTYNTTGGGKVEKSEETIKPKAKHIDNKPASGYEVGEWAVDSFKINIDGGYSVELALKASTGLITYSIQYDLDGGSFASTAPSSYTVEDSVTLPTPTKDGYGFTGWVDGSWEAISSIPAGTTGDLSLTATWSASLNALTVTSSDETKGTVSIISGSGYSDESVTVLATPKEDCLFKGWYHENGLLSEDAQYTFTMPLEDYSLTALFWTNAEQEAAEEARERARGIIPDLSSDGKYVTYGMYPQEKVTDASLISDLNLTADYDTTGWYILNDEFYCKVSSDWYMVQPIKWKVMERLGNEALVVSDLLIDARRYDDSSNNYRDSEIRKWLNGTFLGTAFALGSEHILTTEVDNSAATTDSSSNPYACENTQDKVFLLSYQDYQNAAYGFIDEASRQCKPTGYASAKGTFTFMGFGYYWTRSPYSSHSNRAWNVNYAGYFGGSDYVYGDGSGVRPGLRITIA